MPTVHYCPLGCSSLAIPIAKLLSSLSSELGQWCWSYATLAPSSNTNTPTSAKLLNSCYAPIRDIGTSLSTAISKYSRNKDGSPAEITDICFWLRSAKK